jgi:hypothetical protein
VEQSDSRENSTLRDSTLFDLGGFTVKITQVVQLGSTNVTVRINFNHLDCGRVERECTLDSNAETYFSHGKGFGDACTLAANHDALEDLNSLSVPFRHSHVDFDVVSWSEFRDVISERVTIN